jgi:hypothetical protein
MDSSQINKYFPDNIREQKMWKECIFIFDTSALLNFYNYSPETKDFLFKKVLPKFKNRLWIPYQVEFEFLKNRNKVLKAPINEKYGLLREDHLVKIEDFSSKLSAHILNIKEKTKKKFSHPYIDQNIFSDFDEKHKSFNESLKMLIDKIQAEFDSRKAEILQMENSDDVLQAFESNFQTGKPFSFEKLIEIAKEGEFRYKNKIPPGYEDDKKNKIGLQIYGDLFIWKQILEYARVANKPLVLITDDVKSDWCYVEKVSGETRILRPREELIKEISDCASIDFWMYTVAQFLHNLEKYDSIKTEDKIILEVEQNIHSSSLIYNKIYAAYYKDDDFDYYKCLKFFNDGEVISAAIVLDDLSIESLSYVNKWFVKGYSDRGRYEMIGSSIKFTAKSPAGEVDYSGSIGDKKMALDINSKINGKKGHATFNLIESS